MISVKIDIKGDDKKEIGRIIREDAFQVEAEMKVSMTQAKHGRRYRRGTRTHQASAPGEAPAVDTGFLINSIQTTIKSEIQVETQIGAEYSEALEYGTSKMAARPFVEPAIEGVIERFGRGGIISRLMG
jgi:HK97 gp10 family phage protein